MISITGIEDCRVTKYATFSTLAECEAHATEYHGIVYDGNFTPDLWVENGKITHKPLPEAIPQQVKMAQARKALAHKGLLDLVPECIAGMHDSIQRKDAEIDWEFEPYVKRNSHLVYGLAGGLGLTDEKLDELFLYASKL